MGSTGNNIPQFRVMHDRWKFQKILQNVHVLYYCKLDYSQCKPRVRNLRVRTATNLISLTLRFLRSSCRKEKSSHSTTNFATSLFLTFSTRTKRSQTLIIPSIPLPSQTTTIGGRKGGSEEGERERALLHTTTKKEAR